MSANELFEALLSAKLGHLLAMERNMQALLPKVKRGDEEAKAKYEWYLSCSKQMLAVKDLAALGKLFSPQEEVNEGFDGFDDG